MKDFKRFGFEDYLSMVWRRRWYFLCTSVLVVAGVLVFAWQLPGHYRSETRILIETPFVSEDYVRPVFRSTPEDRISSIRQQLESRTFLERIIEQFQIDGYGIRTDFVMEAAVGWVRKQIGIQKTSANTFTLSFTANDPQFAQAVTRRLADELIRFSTSSQKDKVIATDQFLDEQLRQAAQSLAAEEEKIKQFKVAHLGELPEQSNANMNALSGLQAQLVATENAIQQALDQQKLLDYKQQERKRLNLLSLSIAGPESSLHRPQRQDEAASTSEVELAAKKKLLAAMLIKYTPKHPDVERVSLEIKELEQRVSAQSFTPSDLEAPDGSELTPLGDPTPTTIQADTAKMKEAIIDQESAAFQYEAENIKRTLEKREQEKQEILRQIKVFQARLNLAPTLEQELAALLREEEILRDQYIGLQNKKFTSQLAATVETDKKNETYKIIDEPNLPVKPEFPNRMQIILMGIGSGLILGIAAAIGRELLDPAIGSEEEALALLNLPVLVSISEIPKGDERTRKLIKIRDRIA